MWNAFRSHQKIQCPGTIVHALSGQMHGQSYRDTLLSNKSTPRHFFTVWFGWLEGAKYAFSGRGTLGNKVGYKQTCFYPLSLYKCMGNIWKSSFCTYFTPKFPFVFTLFPYINVWKIYENHHFAHISPQNSHLNVILTLTTNFMAKYKPLGTY